MTKCAAPGAYLDPRRRHPITVDRCGRPMHRPIPSTPESESGLAVRNAWEFPRYHFIRTRVSKPVTHACVRAFCSCCWRGHSIRFDAALLGGPNAIRSSVVVVVFVKPLATAGAAICSRRWERAGRPMGEQSHLRAYIACPHHRTADPSIPTLPTIGFHYEKGEKEDRECTSLSIHIQNADPGCGGGGLLRGGGPRVRLRARGRPEQQQVRRVVI